jgi:hypothetical protein
VQLKSELKPGQCGSEQLVNCEDWLNTEWDRGVQSDSRRNNKKTQ